MLECVQNALVNLTLSCYQMEEEGIPSTALREISLLHMLSESDYVVKWVVLLTLTILLDF